MGHRRPCPEVRYWSGRGRKLEVRAESAIPAITHIVVYALQMLAGHAALTTTQRYIEADVEAQRKVVDLI